MTSYNHLKENKAIKAIVALLDTILHFIRHSITKTSIKIHKSLDTIFNNKPEEHTKEKTRH